MGYSFKEVCNSTCLSVFACSIVQYMIHYYNKSDNNIVKFWISCISVPLLGGWGRQKWLAAGLHEFFFLFK